MKHRINIPGIVMVLAVATAPAGALTLPLLYVGAGCLALLIAFRR